MIDNDTLFDFFKEFRSENKEAHSKIEGRITTLETAKAEANGATKVLGAATETQRQRIQLTRAQWAGIVAVISAVAGLVAVVRPTQPVSAATPPVVIPQEPAP